MIAAIYEGKDGTRFVEIYKTAEGYTIKFPQDPTNTVPYERLDQLKTALEDVIWQKGRCTPIAPVNS
jgi:hypothetical protein